jgi:hypothetical protein
VASWRSGAAPVALVAADAPRAVAVFGEPEPGDGDATAVACVPAAGLFAALAALGAACPPPHADSVVLIAPGFGAGAGRFAAAADAAAREAFYPAQQFVLI